MNRFIQCKLIFATVAILGLATNAVQAQTTYSILSDDFSRTGVLNGSTTTVGNTSWIANDNITTDGTQATTYAEHQNAYLPFAPKAGFVYTLTANLNTVETTNDTWGAFGFTQYTDTAAANWFPGGVGWGWWLQRGQRGAGNVADNTFLGPWTDNGSPPLTIAPSGYSTYQIVLDLTGTQPLFTFSRDGVVQDSRSLGRQATINYLGFGANGTSMSVSNLSLAVSGAAINNPEYTWKGTVDGDPAFNSSGNNWVDSGNNPATLSDGSIVHLVFGKAGINGTTLYNYCYNLTVADPTAYGGGAAAPGIHFTAAAPAYTIDGNTITFQGDIVNDSAHVQTFDCPLYSKGTFAINGNSEVVLNGEIQTGGLKIGSTTGSQGHVTLANLSPYNSNSIGEFSVGTIGTGTLTMNDAVTLTNSATALRVGGDGNPTSANGTLTMLGTATINHSDDDLTIGWGTGATGLLQMKDSSIFNFTTGNWTYIGIGGQGEISMSGIATFNGQGDMRFGQGGGGGRLTMTGSTTLNSTGGWIYFGTDGNGTSYADLSGTATINKTGGDIRIGNGGSIGIMTMTDNAQIFHNTPNWFIVGSSGGNGTLTMSGHSTITKTQSDLVVGIDDGSTGKLILKDSASLLYSGGDWTNIGYGNGAKGTLEVHDNATFTTSSGALLVGRDGGNGTVTLDGVNPITFNYFANIIGDNGTYGAARSTTGTMTMSGAVSTTFNNSLVIGNHPGATGTLDITDGARLEHLNANEIQIGVSGTGSMIVHGGTAAVHPVVINRGSMRVGHVDERNAGPGTGTLDLSGYAEFIEMGDDMRAVSVATFGSTGTMSLADHASYTQDAGNFWLTWGGGGNGTLNLKGGVFESRNIISDGGTATINWQGGIYRVASGGDASPLFCWNGGTETINVGKGANGLGAIVDTTNPASVNGVLTYGITLNVDLLHDPSVAGLDGGLTKIGPNSLTINGNLGYNGNTTVNEGSLIVGNINTPNATVFAAADSTLTATSIVADTLTIGGAPIVINAATLAVPEPSTLVLLALAGVAFVGAYLRRK